MMDDEFANNIAADIHVVLNQQELMDQSFFHVNTREKSFAQTLRKQEVSEKVGEASVWSDTCFQQ